MRGLPTRFLSPSSPSSGIYLASGWSDGFFSLFLFNIVTQTQHDQIVMENAPVPRRSLTSIQPLPSIYTVFPSHYTRVSSSTASGGLNSPRVEDGLEVVPLERDGILSAPILSPWYEEKEVYLISQEEFTEKPLPSPPRSLWKRMSVKYRVISLLALQAAILLTVGLALLSIKRRNASRYVSRRIMSSHVLTQMISDSSNEIRKAGNDVVATSVDPIRRGTFVLPIESAQQQSSTCLTENNESRAWQCMFDTTLQLNILPSSADDVNKTLITLGPATGTTESIHCGQQAPETLPTELKMVMSSANATSYHFQTSYNRTVMLRGDQLDAGFVPKENGRMQHATFQAGDSLWRCTFEESHLEGYISVEKSAESLPPVMASATNSSTAALERMPYSLKLVEQITSSDNLAYCERVEVTPTEGLVTRSERTVLHLAESTSFSSSGTWK
jgi:hypothetical protein